MLRILALLSGSLLLGACTSAPTAANSFLGFITPYRIDIVQGNVVTREQLQALKTGMSREQVRNVLGTPLVADAFHAQRWDYIFTIRRPGTDPQRRSIVVRFDAAGAMTGVEAPEDLPTEREFVDSITRNKDEKPTVPKLELTEAERMALPRPPKREDTNAEPEIAGPARAYPPLEAS
ncbi:cell envelope protein SmpA [Rubrivivax gelatinosus]|uniref:Outer membrane protein assembly factor BamE n=1 Tax=Rubrivivax gelatinosus TaxID=28068 RepID=A0ABS1DPH9_RUBGE|nr:outer membrane protein assembly factor BamE [Rubrivivax gelatinosus]MBK1612857.1 cell envelope protein SmpA [Rubrivivax gelatinosus]MBK1711924.1 cell envelope protein SmpA [Rubrivivax gelatinosus]